MKKILDGTFLLVMYNNELKYCVMSYSYNIHFLNNLWMKVSLEIFKLIKMHQIFVLSLNQFVILLFLQSCKYFKITFIYNDEIKMVAPMRVALMILNYLKLPYCYFTTVKD